MTEIVPIYWYRYDDTPESKETIVSRHESFYLLTPIRTPLKIMEREEQTYTAENMYKSMPYGGN